MQSTGFHISDLVQIDDFITHAKFHSEQYGDNVFVFISKHYGELKAQHDKEHQEEQEDHEQLPFNNHQNHTTAITDFTLQFFKVDIKSLINFERTSNNFSYIPPSSSLFLETILQPPRHS